MVTIREVAKHAGVSPATVSRVVNGLVGYSDETRERVETAVKSLNYETDYLARGLKTPATKVPPPISATSTMARGTFLRGSTVSSVRVV